MLFVTVGTQKFQFNRLLKYIDELISEGVITENVFCQSGYSNYIPHHYECYSFLTANEFEEKIDESNIVVTHSGVGTILKALKKRKKVIVIPRLAEFEEHIDNHQVQIAEGFAQSGYILLCNNKKELKECFCTIDSFSANEYISNNGFFLKCLKEYLQDL